MPGPPPAASHGTRFRQEPLCLLHEGGAQVTRHFLKILPEHFQPVHDRMKKAELRKDDREPTFARHDELVLQEWDGEFTGREVAFLVTHALRGGVVPKGYAMLSGDRLKCSCCDGWTYMPLPGGNQEVANGGIMGV